MKFIIEEIRYRETVSIVTGRTTIGTIKGIWKCEDNPVMGNSYFVELTITSPSEISIMEEAGLFPLVRLDNEYVIFRGICEDSDGDVCYVRFDDDWIDMLEIDEITSKKKKGDYILFSAYYYDIGIYPYKI